MKNLKIADNKRVSSSSKEGVPDKRIHSAAAKAPVSKAVVTKYGKCGNITFVPRELRQLFANTGVKKSKVNILHRSTGSPYAVSSKNISHVSIRQVFEGKGSHSGKVKQDSTVRDATYKKSKLSIHQENRGKSCKNLTKNPISPVGSKKVSKSRHSERNVHRSEIPSKPTYRRCFACEHILKSHPHIFAKKTKSLPSARVNPPRKSDPCIGDKQREESCSEQVDEHILNAPVYYGITPVMTASQRVFEWLQNISRTEVTNHERNKAVTFCRSEVEKSGHHHGRRSKGTEEKKNATSHNPLLVYKTDVKAEVSNEIEFPKERHKTWKHDRSRINLKITGSKISNVIPSQNGRPLWRH